MNIKLPGNDYTEINYPGGELQIRLTDPERVRSADTISIYARIRTATDMMRLALLVSAIDDVDELALINLHLPYLPYARADRRFVTGDCEGLKVFSVWLNSCDFDSVHVLDSHNRAVTTDLINNIYDHHPMAFIKQSMDDFGKGEPLTILLPDEGAARRYEFPNGCMGPNVFFANATKKRNVVTGKFEGFVVPTEIKTGNVLIVDDICDGGGTFMGIAKELEHVGSFTLGLYVTHGIFSQGLDGMRKWFKHIYTTNSFQELVSDNVLTVFNAFPTEGNAI